MEVISGHIASLILCRVTFAASGADAIAVTWDFGDGETSTSLRPVHTYEAGGTYPV
ncbi:MAG: PKD domain-containing protein, partial [Draconibacterium sp.]